MITYPFTEEDVCRALTDLGDRHDVVANSLSVRGFKGVIDDCTACPVATYLWAVVEEVVAVSVGDAAIDLVAARIIDGFQERYELRVDTPDPVSDFIAGFDSHGYPDLIKERVS